ncbi:hypothetical protein BSZ35_09110 [Salinibacter sp. 10B]|uniref:hypothetical protein n=1 Tax=Salinibacter sp. 10B TaxID=1923971 RepID=UPI000CF50431|nr:hypothetical protein [Salinibacter sp. 10B]PQJ34736.1 hypothetical protein BSZ35_09110 [Salinibacter sp. 10B]
MNQLDKVKLSTLATTVFVSSFFFLQISIGGDPLIRIPLYQAELMLNLGLAALAFHMQSPSVAQTRRLVGILGTIAVTQLGYFLMVNVYPIAGSLTEYVIAAVRVYGYIVSVTVYACLFYDEDLLLKTFYQLGRLCLGVGLAALLVYKMTGLPFLLDLSYGNIRPQAFFTEPSAAAPAVASVGLVAWKKSDWMGLALAVAFATTSNSATVLLVFILSIFGVYLVRRGPWAVWGGVLGTFGSMFAFIGLGGLDWLKTASYFGRTINRLARGIEFIITLSQQGYNPRFAGAINVYQQLQEKGLLWIGYGLNSASPYFRHVYTGTGTDVQDYSLFVTTFFSFGVMGVLVLVLFVHRAIVIMYRKESGLVYVFIPFFLASMINSAQGFVMYKFVILGIVVYGVGRRLSYDCEVRSANFLS